jgi:hypothetical protein
MRDALAEPNEADLKEYLNLESGTDYQAWDTDLDWLAAYLNSYWKTQMAITTLADGGLLIGNATGAIEAVAAGLTTQVLVGGGALTAPVWGTDLPTAVTIGSGYVYRAGGTDVADADVADNITITAGSQIQSGTPTFTAVDLGGDTATTLTGSGGVLSVEGVPVEKVFDVRKYGATPNDATDDTVAFTAMFDAIEAAGGGTAYIPNGTYMVEAITTEAGETDYGIHIPSNCEVRFDPNVVIQAIGNAGNAPYSILVASEETNIVIHGNGATLYGDAETAGKTLDPVTTAGTGLRIEGCTDVWVYDLTVTQVWGDGFVIIYDDDTSPWPESTNANLINCRATANYRNGAAIVGAIGGGIFGGSYDLNVGTAPQDGIDIEPNGDKDGEEGPAVPSIVRDFTVTGASCYSNGKNGLEAVGMGTVDNVSFKDNFCYSNGQDGIVYRSGNNGTITGNHCYSNAAIGISSYLVTDMVIANNVAADNTGNGISVANPSGITENISVVGNTVSGNSGGVSIAGTSGNPIENISVIGNISTGSVGTGITISWVNTGTISDNVSHLNGTHGFNIVNSTDLTIVGNNADTNSQTTDVASDNYILTSVTGFTMTNNIAREGAEANDARYGINAAGATSPGYILYNDITGGGSTGELNNAGGATVIPIISGLNSLAGLTETNGGIPYGTADNTYAWLAAGTSGYALTANGAGAPSWTGFTGTGNFVKAASPTLTGTLTLPYISAESTTIVKFRASDASNTIGLDLGYSEAGSTTGYIFNRYNGNDASALKFGFGAAGSTTETVSFYKNGNVDMTTSGATLTVGTGGSGTVSTGVVELGHASDTTLSRPAAGRLQVETVEVAIETPTAGVIMYGDGTTWQGLAAGATTEILVGGGAAAPVWTTATGTGAPVRAGSPTFTGTVTTPIIDVTDAYKSGGTTIISSGLSVTNIANVKTTQASAATPSHSFYLDNDTGMYGSGTNALGFSTAGVYRGGFDSSGNFGLQNNLTVSGTTVNMTTDGTILQVGTSNDSGTVSAGIFTDRTWFPSEDYDALREVVAIRGIDGEIDHDTLPELTRVETKDGDTERDLGKMVSILTVAIQQQQEMIAELQRTVDELSKGKKIK